MRKNKTFLIVLMVIVLILSISTGIYAAKKYTIKAVVHGGIADPYWKKVEMGMKAAEKLYPDLELSYIGPATFKFRDFMQYLQAAIDSEPDGLICTMTKPEAMDEVLRPAIKKGLPVIAVDSPDPRGDLDRIPYLTYVGEIPYDVGKMAAMVLLENFEPKRTIYANHHPGALNLQRRGEGWLDIMEEAGIPSEALDIGADPTKGAQIMVEYLIAHPDTDVVFTGNLLRAEALLVQLEDEGIKPGKDVKILTFGVDSKILDAILNGEVMFSLDEQPYLQGFLTTQFMYQHLKYGFNFPEKISTAGVFSEDNIKHLKDLIEQGIR